MEPTFTEHEGDDASALALVISLNVQRRDLTAAQRAIVAARALEGIANGWGGDRKSSEKTSHLKGTKSRDNVAVQFKVSDKSVQQAKAVLTEAPDLTAQVEACTLSLAAAYDQLQQRREQAKRKAKDAERIAEYKDAISSGETTLEKALQEIMERERQEREKVTHDAQARQMAEAKGGPLTSALWNWGSFMRSSPRKASSAWRMGWRDGRRGNSFCNWSTVR